MGNGIRRSGGVVAFGLGAILIASTGLRAQSTTCLSIDPATGATVGGITPSISADGRWVVFATRHAYDARDTWGQWSIYRVDRASGQYALASLNGAGNDVNAPASLPVVSDDGRFVAFVSQGKFTMADTNSHADIYRRNLVLGVTKLVSADVNGASLPADAATPSMSGDGDLIAFMSKGALVPADTNHREDVYVRRMSTGTLELVSATPTGASGDDDSRAPALSADGSTCVFYSWADDLVPNSGGSPHVYARDLATGTTTIVTCDPNGVPVQGTAGTSPAVSGDGRFVSFTFSGDLDLDPATSHAALWVKDRATGAVARANLDEAGDPDYSAIIERLSLSRDGRHLLFLSDSPTLVDEDSETAFDVFARDLQLGMTSCLSLATDGSQSTGLVALWANSISSDGRSAVFQSNADDLHAGDSHFTDDVFVRERDFAAATAATYGTGLGGTLGTPALVASAPPLLNASITLDLSNSFPWYTVGLFLVGQSRAAMPAFGGTLLVDPLVSSTFVANPGTLRWPASIPSDELMAGDLYVIQGLLLDPGAPEGVALSNGLELVLGY